ncbi:hypothetical protein HDU84_001775 [Entophlyctis sp. JEL0112]|nr:hypothetical protein HDU84_001775 [Entophlyctis sp. JEL0112]
MARGTVAVIGAGPVGACVAISLKKRGFEPTLYDRLDVAKAMDTARETGAPAEINFGEVQGGSISMYTNGQLALERLGLLDDVLSAPHEAMRDATLMKIDGSDGVLRFSASEEYKYAPFHVLRSVLHATLMRACLRNGVKVLTSKKLVNLTQTDDAVTCSFEDGSVITADLVIGADGIHSATRRAIFPDLPKPVFWSTGYIGTFDRGIDIGDGVKLDLHHKTGSGIYADALTGNIIYTANCNEKIGSWMVMELDAPQSAENENETWRPHTDLPKESKRLAAVVESWGSPKEVVATVAGAKRITPLNIYDLPDLPELHKGRVLLVGDAAHGTIPALGQGLCSGVEDACVLGELFDKFQDYKTVFELYDKVRIPRVRTITKGSRDIASRLKAPSPFMAKLGRFLMKIILNIKRNLGTPDAIVMYDYKSDLHRVLSEYSAAAS